MKHGLRFSIHTKMSKKSLVLVIAAIMVITSFSALISIQGSHSYASVSGKNLNGNPTGQNPESFGPMVEVATPPQAISTSSNVSYNGNVNVLVTFKLSNQTELNNFLSELSDKASPLYHKYITRQQFESRYGVSNSTYSEAANYFSNFNNVKVRSYADHVSLGVSGPASQISKAFNTTIVNDGNGSYSADSTPSLPSAIGSSVSFVTGLSNAKMAVSLNLNYGATPSMGPRPASNGYPSLGSNPQTVYGSNMQVAYNEQSLLNVTYPTNEVVATILWSGHNSTNQKVGPFVPSDIYNYFNATLPSYEPHSKVYGVPLNGAPKPGISASNDSTGVNVENTLDLEMIGSTAPGSKIYNVYGPSGTMQNIDAAFAYILSPTNPNYSALNNVSVISNSWGTSDYNNTAWVTYLEEAQARGITVLASSGDSGDNAKSRQYLGGPDYTEFPSSMAYNNFGVTAVGGTTVLLSQSSALLNQTAWYESYNYTYGYPAGSTGGISANFTEPSWQLNSLANNILQDQGRGVPDIGALANNTNIYITSSSGGVTSSGYTTLGGTSVASPIEAGIVAEMNAVLNKYNQSNLGYLNPLIYKLADMQFANLSNNYTSTFAQTGTYNSSLPVTPFYNVDSGRNHVYTAGYPYNLVTGWGSIDAYNFTNLVLNRSFSYQTGKLDGVQNNLTLSGLNVTSYTQTSIGVAGGSVNEYYNASVQQNFFVADELGAPIYWIQNVIYINGSASQGWQLNYTGWVIFPFYGQYPTQVVFEYNFPLTGKVLSMPHSFDMRSWITGTGLSAIMNFRVNSQVLQIPIPGAAYIISGSNYTYSWQGHTYYNGPYPDNSIPGGLTPQFGLVGGPSLGIGEFQSPTSGHMTASVRPMGYNSYVNATTSTYTYNVDQTGESASNLQWTQAGNNSWNLGISIGSTTQGVLSYEPNDYNVSIFTKGLPMGSKWYANLSNGMKSGPVSSGNYAFYLPNGTYKYTVESSNSRYGSVNGTFTVSGSNVQVYVNMSIQLYRIMFTETGLPKDTPWNLVFNGTMHTGNSTNYSTIVVYAANGAYSYRSENTSSYYSSTWSTETLTVNGEDQNITVAYNEYSRIAGVISPSDATLSVNGKDYSIAANGSFNIELVAGNYTLKVSDQGYNTTYLNISLTTGETFNQNFTLGKAITINPGGPAKTFNPNAKTPYYFLGGALGIIVLAGISFALRRKRR